MAIAAVELVEVEFNAQTWRVPATRSEKAWFLSLLGDLMLLVFQQKGRPLSHRRPQKKPLPPETPEYDTCEGEALATELLEEFQH